MTFNKERLGKFGLSEIVGTRHAVSGTPVQFQIVSLHFTPHYRKINPSAKVTALSAKIMAPT